MKRRPAGTGTLTEKRPGVWALRWYVGRDPITGHHRQRQETFAGTKTDAQRRLSDHIAIAGRTPTVSRLTVAGLIERWQAAATVKPATRDRYHLALAHMPAALGAMTAADVVTATLRATFDALDKAKVSRHTIYRPKRAISAA